MTPFDPKSPELVALAKSYKDILSALDKVAKKHERETQLSEQNRPQMPQNPPENRAHTPITPMLNQSKIPHPTPSEEGDSPTTPTPTKPTFNKNRGR